MHIYSHYHVLLPLQDPGSILASFTTTADGSKQIADAQASSSALLALHGLCCMACSEALPNVSVT